MFLHLNSILLFLHPSAPARDLRLSIMYSVRVLQQGVVFVWCATDQGKILPRTSLLHATGSGVQAIGIAADLLQ